MKPPGTVRHWFYIAVAVLMIFVNIAAFAPSMLNPSTRNTPLPLTPLVTLHAAMAVGWLLLFLAQATLVATGHTNIHRRLGLVGVVLIIGFTVTGIATVVTSARRGFDLSGDLSRMPPPPGTDPRASIMITAYFFIIFAVLAGAAIWFRRRPAIHKRLMVLAALGGLTMTPVAHLIGHWPVLQPWTPLIFPVSLLCCLSLLAIWDRVSEGRIHPVSVWGALAVFVATLVVNVVILPSRAWQDIAVWLIQ